jgi:hypothetical protein
MLSQYPPERLQVELQSRLGPMLSQRGFRLVGHGPNGVTWRRQMTGKVIGGLVVLGLLALSGFSGGTAGSVTFGVLCLAGAALLVFLRHPASVTVSLVRTQEGGTELAVIGGRDAARAEPIARTVAGPAPVSRPPTRPEPPGGLWRTPNG